MKHRGNGRLHAVEAVERAAGARARPGGAAGEADGDEPSGAGAPSTHDGPLDALIAETPEITPLGRRTGLAVMLFLEQAPTLSLAVLDCVDAGRLSEALPAVRGLRRVADELGLLRLGGVCMGLEGALRRGDVAGASRWAARLADAVARARRLLSDLGACEE